MHHAPDRGETSVTWLDVAITVSVCVSAVFGFWKGIVRAVLGIAGLLGGLLLAGAYYRQVAASLWPAGETWSLFAAYALILVGVLAAAAVLAALLSRLIHMTALGLVDRIIGLVVGALVAAMAWAALLDMLQPLVPGIAGLISDSPFAHALADWLTHTSGATATGAHLPQQSG